MELKCESGFLQQPHILKQGIIVLYVHALLKYDVLLWGYGVSMGHINQSFMRMGSFWEC